MQTNTLLQFIQNYLLNLFFIISFLIFGSQRFWHLFNTFCFAVLTYLPHYVAQFLISSNKMRKFTDARRLTDPRTKKPPIEQLNTSIYDVVTACFVVVVCKVYCFRNYWPLLITWIHIKSDYKYAFLILYQTFVVGSHIDDV